MTLRCRYINPDHQEKTGLPTSHCIPLIIPLLSCSFSSATSVSDSDEWPLPAVESSRPIGRSNMSSPSWYLPQFLRLANYLTLKLICGLNGVEPDKWHHVILVSWRWWNTLAVAGLELCRGTFLLSTEQHVLTVDCLNKCNGTFLYGATGFQEQHCYVEGSQVSLVCISSKSNT